MYQLLSSISGGGASQVKNPPVPDGYFWAIIVFIALICFQIVRLVLNVIKLKKLTGKSDYKASGIFPYVLVTAFTQKSIEIFLTVLIVVFGALYFVNRVLSRKIKKFMDK